MRSVLVPENVSYGEKSTEVFLHLRKKKHAFGFLHTQWKIVYCQPVIDFGKFRNDCRNRWVRRISIIKMSMAYRWCSICI